MSSGPAIVWFRQDLRVSDNPALAAAASSGRPIVPLFILDGDSASGRDLGAACRWWLHHSLAHMSETLVALGSPLVVRAGTAANTLDAVIAETGACAVYWNRIYSPTAIARDTAIKSRLKDRGLFVESTNSHLLTEPWSLKTKSGSFFKVFTPFWRTFLNNGPPSTPIQAPRNLIAPGTAPQSATLDDLGLLPTPNWAAAFTNTWTPGEAGAQARLTRFLAGPINRYATDRDRPDQDAVSGLSPHLRWGEIGPRQIWAATERLSGQQTVDRKALDKFRSELGWREFAHVLLFNMPDIITRSMDEKFERFPWSDDTETFKAWQQGRTGYPIVDAGMRQLWQTGWMHNRVRMIVGSFLVKHLLHDWRAGERWFWDTLVDADPASNPASWQWVAGCGADGAPFFRIFNPMTQGEKFDPNGTYVRTYVRELDQMPAKYIHTPWLAPADVLETAGVVLGKTYPRPIVDHREARNRALEAFGSLKLDKTMPESDAA